MGLRLERQGDLHSHIGTLSTHAGRSEHSPDPTLFTVSFITPNTALLNLETESVPTHLVFTIDIFPPALQCSHHYSPNGAVRWSSILLPMAKF